MNFQERCEESPFGLLRWCCTAQSLVRFQIRSRRNLPGQRRARGRLRSRHHRPHRHSRRFPRRCPRLFCPVAALDGALSSTLPTPALAAAIAGSISTALAAALTDAINIALAQAAPLARRGFAATATWEVVSVAALAALLSRVAALATASSPPR